MPPFALNVTVYVGRAAIVIVSLFFTVPELVPVAKEAAILIVCLLVVRLIVLLFVARVVVVFALYPCENDYDVPPMLMLPLALAAQEPYVDTALRVTLTVHFVLVYVGVTVHLRLTAISSTSLVLFHLRFLQTEDFLFEDFSLH